MNKYKVKMQFVFDGEYDVLADTVQEAKVIIKKNAGAILDHAEGDNNSIHILDWDVDVHNSDIRILNVILTRKNIPTELSGWDADLDPDEDKELSGFLAGLEI